MQELVPLAERIGALLTARKETVAVAESSAGGLISATLLAVPGASAYFIGGDGVPIPADTQTDKGNIEMHLPLAAFAGIVAMLQHDSPIDLEFKDQRGHLWTAEWERVGETERG